MKRRTRLRFVLEGLEGVAVLGATVLSWPISRVWLRNWGSKKPERRRRWVGDDLVNANYPPSTRAIEIAAPAAIVWQWLAQFGLRKAGFYSYELLERLIGIPVTNIESIEPSMQSVSVGDEVLLHPKAPGIPVAMVEPRRHLCFGEDSASEGKGKDPAVKRSWSFYVSPVSADRCRLLVRGCFEMTRGASVKHRVGLAVEQPIDFVMEQRMLRTIKRLAEA